MILAFEYWNAYICCMKTHKVKTVQTIKQVVDSESGELLSEDYDVKHFTISVDTNENFFIVFSSAVNALSGNKLSALDEKLLRWMCIRAVYNKNRVGLQKNVKLEFCKDNDVKLQSVANSIHKLKQAQVIVSEGNGNYIINPKFFWRGDKNKRGDSYDLFMSIYKKSI